MQHLLEWELADNYPARERYERHLYCGSFDILMMDKEGM
jgi:hypothetical protein